MNEAEKVAELDAVLHKMKAAGWITGWTIITDPWIVDWTDLGKLRAAEFLRIAGELGLVREQHLYLHAICRFLPALPPDESEKLGLN
ncbi:MAG TPA: hypothetical protein VHG71_11690 [Verrucomicrobiae bacterium]|nr:hypothetical protein [Verrucomicrobiae bacterium]